MYRGLQTAYGNGVTSPQQRATSQTWEQRAYEHLYCLCQALNRYDEISADLRDNTLHVEYATGTGEGTRRERVECAPRPSDGDRLWMWDSQRGPLAEADDTVAATLAVVSKLRRGLTPPWGRR